jgi:hypothetical protein
VLLAGADALDQAIHALGFEVADCRRLDALSGMLRNEREFSGLSRQVVQRALEACARIRPWLDKAPTKTVARLAKFRAIDPGEAALLATMIEDRSLSFLSGDKRWMRVLGGQPELRDIRETIAGRVICLETVVESMIRQWGIRTTARLLTPARSHSQTLKVLFSDGEKTREDNCLEGIRSYIADLERVVGEGFLLSLR